MALGTSQPVKEKFRTTNGRISRCGTEPPRFPGCAVGQRRPAELRTSVADARGVLSGAQASAASFSRDFKLRPTIDDQAVGLRSPLVSAAIRGKPAGSRAKADLIGDAAVWACSAQDRRNARSSMSLRRDRRRPSQPLGLVWGDWLCRRKSAGKRGTAARPTPSTAAVCSSLAGKRTAKFAPAGSQPTRFTINQPTDGAFRSCW